MKKIGLVAMALVLAFAMSVGVMAATPTPAAAAHGSFVITDGIIVIDGTTPETNAGEISGALDGAAVKVGGPFDIEADVEYYATVSDVTYHAKLYANGIITADQLVIIEGAIIVEEVVQVDEMLLNCVGWIEVTRSGDVTGYILGDSTTAAQPVELTIDGEIKFLGVPDTFGVALVGKLLIPLEGILDQFVEWTNYGGEFPTGFGVYGITGLTSLGSEVIGSIGGIISFGLGILDDVFALVNDLLGLMTSPPAPIH